MVLIPTYNESENVFELYAQIKNRNMSANILFLDDNSPDGTGDIIKKIKEQDSTVFSIHRVMKSGIGNAHITGIKWAYEKGYDKVLTMDCDFSHSPSYISSFLELSQRSDVIIGSRFLVKGSLAGWNLYRKFLTRLGHLITGLFLGIPYDATGAYRLYNLKNIPRSLFDLVLSKNYAFFFESLLVLQENHIKIDEFAIKLPPRTYGQSKMSVLDMVNSLITLLNLLVRTQLFGGRRHVKSGLESAD